jgi:hypothetical protein
MAVTLVYAAQSTGSYTTEAGSASFSCNGTEMLLYSISAFSTGDFAAPADSNGTFTKDTASYQAFLDSATSFGGWYTQFPVNAGTHTITPPAVPGGSDTLVRVIKVTGVTGAIRDRAKNRQVSGSQNFTLTTGAAPLVGDLAFGVRCHENSVGSTCTITQPAGWTPLIQYLDGSVNLPTDVSWITVSANGALAGLWTTNDAAVTDTSGAIIVLVPAGAGGARVSSFQSQPMIRGPM